MQMVNNIEAINKNIAKLRQNLKELDKNRIIAELRVAMLTAQKRMLIGYYSPLSQEEIDEVIENRGMYFNFPFLDDNVTYDYHNERESYNLVSTFMSFLESENINHINEDMKLYENIEDVTIDMAEDYEHFSSAEKMYMDAAINKAQLETEAYSGKRTFNKTYAYYGQDLIKVAIEFSTQMVNEGKITLSLEQENMLKELKDNGEFCEFATEYFDDDQFVL